VSKHEMITDYSNWKTTVDMLLQFFSIWKPSEM